MFEARFEGVAELVAAVESGVDRMVVEVRHGATRATQTAVQQIRSDAPKKTHELEKSISGRVRPTKNGAYGSIEIEANHASFVKDGTPPHEIRAKNAKALRFDAGGAIRFAKSVQHPGTKPNDFVSPGVQEGQQVLEHDALEAAKRLKAKIEG